MKKLILIGCALTLSTLINLSFGQQIQHKAVKKQEVSSNIAIEQPIIHNYDGSFQLIVKEGIDVIDATFDENIITSLKSSYHLFSQDFLSSIEQNRLTNEFRTIEINKNLKVVLSPRKLKTGFYKTAFITSNN
jgi:hypothetical protein